MFHRIGTYIPSSGRKHFFHFIHQTNFIAFQNFSSLFIGNNNIICKQSFAVEYINIPASGIMPFPQSFQRTVFCFQLFKKIHRFSGFQRAEIIAEITDTFFFIRSAFAAVANSAHIAFKEMFVARVSPTGGTYIAVIDADGFVTDGTSVNMRFAETLMTFGAFFGAFPADVGITLGAFHCS
jgi:hypothetical protein